MTEVFKPRKNMTYDKIWEVWFCQDENKNYICDGGPSIIWNDGTWYFNDHFKGYHRLDGPATSDGAWYINNRKVTEEIRKFAKENNIDLKNISDEDKVLIALTFG